MGSEKPPSQEEREAMLTACAESGEAGVFANPSDHAWHDYGFEKGAEWGLSFVHQRAGGGWREALERLHPLEDAGGVGASFEEGFEAGWHARAGEGEKRGLFAGKIHFSFPAAVDQRAGEPPTPDGPEVVVAERYRHAYEAAEEMLALDPYPEPPPGLAADDELIRRRDRWASRYTAIRNRLEAARAALNAARPEERTKR